MQPYCIYADFTIWSMPEIQNLISLICLLTEKQVNVKFNAEFQVFHWGWNFEDEKKFNAKRLSRI